MEKPDTPPSAGAARSLQSYAWWIVLCLVGLDYFSTLAYLPSMVVDEAGDNAPFAAVAVVIVTLLVVLPIYLYVVGRSPNGRGVTGLLESYSPGWSGKVLVLVLLGFVAADFVVTRTLSTADASLHLLHNSYWQAHANWIAEAREWLREALPPKLQGEIADQVLDWWDEQLTVTVILSVVGFSLFYFLLRGFTRGFMVVAGVIVGLFVLVNGVVVVSSVIYLVQHPDYLTHWTKVHRVVTDRDPYTLALWVTAEALWEFFPVLALGLGGFELSLASVGLVRGKPGDDPALPRGRIRNARKLLVAAAFLMSLFVLGSVLAATLLVPEKYMKGDGPARNRALAYLAHGGHLKPPDRDPNAPPGERPGDEADDAEMPAQPGDPEQNAETAPELKPKGPTAKEVNPLFDPDSPVFGTLYDVSAILILFLAGASVTISLRDLLPQYLARYGMELDWARRTGVLLHLFNLIILVVILYFHASVSHQQGAYSTSVLVLLASAALAAAVDMSHRWKRSIFLPFLTVPLALICVLFLVMAGRVAVERNPAGAVIAFLFVAVIFVTAGFSRWLRSKELRFQGFLLADEHTQTRWEEIRQMEFQVLVPHRPNHLTLADKDREIRARHRLAADVPVIFIEAELGDPSDFQHQPLMKIAKDNGMEVIRVSRCASIAHVLTAIALEFSVVGRPPEIHFAWSEESPLAATFHFLLWGQGNIPLLVHSLIAKTEPDPARRPRVVIG